jgi:hypothetical protein
VTTAPFYFVLYYAVEGIARLKKDIFVPETQKYVFFVGGGRGGGRK